MKLLKELLTMSEKIKDICRYCGKEFKKMPNQRYFLCGKCFHERYKPISHLISLQELDTNWDEKKHLLDFPEDKKHEFNCLCCGKHQSVPMEHSNSFMCRDCFVNEFRPRRERYNLSYDFLKNHWNLIIKLESIFEELIITNFEFTNNINKNILDGVIALINKKLEKNPLYVLSKKY